MQQPTPAAPRPPARPELVATGFGAHAGGGLYVIGSVGAEPRVLDRVSTTGLCVHPRGDRVARLLWTNDDPDGVGELIVYDARGVLRYQRLDSLREPHSALWSGDELVVVSTLDDRVLWLDELGHVVRSFTGHGGGDCWHLNCVAASGGRLLASAFGRFDRHRGWAAPGARAGAGIVFDLATGADVLTGLDAPHDPLPYGDGWLICNSGSQELLELDAAGAVVARVALGGWTRGLALDEHHVYVGVSERASLDHAARARIVVLDRATYEVVAEHPLPCEEVYELTWVPADLVRGLTAGFAVNEQRRNERTILESGTAQGINELLGDADSMVELELTNVPVVVRPGAHFTVGFRAWNRGTAPLTSAGTYPVKVGTRWAAADGTQVGPEARARLTGTLEPGDGQSGVLLVEAPGEPGPFVLMAGALQEQLRWFGDVDARSWSVHHVLVDAERAPTPWAPGGGPTGPGAEPSEAAQALPADPA